MQYVKIPKDRVSILIGKDGKGKRYIEKKTKTEINVEKDGDVTIEGNPMDEWITKDIIKAIGRGFSPEKALKLLNENNTLEIIPLREFANTEKALKRKRGRVIGEKGKAKEIIENLTNTYISIYGKTIGIIGPYEGVDVAKEAIIRLLNGATHKSVYKFLEKNIPSFKKIPSF